MFTDFSSHTQQAQKAVKQIMDQHLVMLTNLSDEIARLEQTGFTTATAAIDESTKAVKESFGAALKARDSVKAMAEDAAKKAWDEKAFQPLAAFRALCEEQAGRMTAIQEQVTKLEGEARERSENGVEEYARLMKESLRYGVEVSGQWRKLMVEATRRVADILTPSA
ncbi:MAG TPA: hypothetical protein VGQ83_05275 [Polyangia bacterium]|jgi:hypothetical protein